MPATQPPNGIKWLVLNHLHISVIFVNNYGRHSHTFKAQPTGFLWDWLGMAAPFPGTGCITVNGMFLAWTRSTRADLDASADILEQALGAAMEEHEQMEWPLE